MAGELARTSAVPLHTLRLSVRRRCQAMARRLVRFFLASRRAETFIHQPINLATAADQFFFSVRSTKLDLLWRIPLIL